MIKVTSEKGNVNLSIEGSLACLKTDFIFICRAMIGGIAEKSEKAAEEFERFLTNDLEHDLKLDTDSAQREALEMLKKLLKDDGGESIVEILANCLKEIVDET